MTLYRKYRPQTFEELVGQDHIKITLENEIKTDQISHAYLFSGPRGIGKTTCARLLAKIINCQNKKKNGVEPCNKCVACQEISQGKSLDVMEIDAASQTGVDNVRENIIENSRFVSRCLKYKIFIIDEAHMLSLSAFNALLKILEEPPAHIIFILATTEINKIPETIISRCQQFNFKKIEFSKIVERLNKICHLEKIKVDLQILKNIARQSQGYLRDAESLLGQILVLGEKKISLEQSEIILPHSNFDLILELTEYLFEKNKKAALILINKLIEQGIDLKYFIGDFIEMARKILLVKIDLSLNEFSQEMDKKIEEKILKLAEKIETENLAKTIEILIKAQKELGETDIIQLPIEIAVLEIIESINNQQSTINNETLKYGNNKTKEFVGANGIRPENIKIQNQYLEVQTPKGQSSLNAEVEPRENSVGAYPCGRPENIETQNAKRKTQNHNLKFKIKDKKNNETENLKSEILNHKSKIKLEEIKEKWGKILEEIKKHNHSIFTFLRTAELLSLKENILQIGFNHKFYQQRINDRKNKEIIENVLEDILKQKIILKVEIFFKKDNFSKKTQDNFLGNILNIFNGKVIE